MVARFVRDEEVRGSNPRTPTEVGAPEIRRKTRPIGRVLIQGGKAGRSRLGKPDPYKDTVWM